MIRTNNTVRETAMRLLAQVRDRQLRLAQKGRVAESAHYAWLAGRLHRWLEGVSKQRERVVGC